MIISRVMKSRNGTMSNKELQEKLKPKKRNNPVDDAIKTILKSQSECCVRARAKLEELEKKDEEK